MQMATNDLAGLRTVFDAAICSLDSKVLGRKADSLVRLQGVHFGSTDVLRYERPGLRVGKRRVQQIRDDGVDDIIIAVPLSAPIVLSQSGLLARVEPENFVFLATYRYFGRKLRHMDHISTAE